MKASFFILSVPLSIPIMFSCAVKESPSGGPVDTTRPTILAVKPAPLSVGLPLDTEFGVTFSEPMNREKTVSAVYLSPVFWDYPVYKWNGRELIIKPPGRLEENKTYVLTIGADATGHHGNQMGLSYSFAFSTGPAIDSGYISGSIYLDTGQPTAYDIWVYAFRDTDTAAFLADIPQYATQADSNYQFKISNIASGKYLVVAVDDKNDDLFWDPTSESIGLPSILLELESGGYFEDLVLRPARRDTVLAEISRVKAIDSRKISVEFSQPVLEERKIDAARYQILASDSTYLAVEGAYIGNEGKLVVETGRQEAEKTYWLKPNRLFSLWGNGFDTSGARFTGSPLADTAGPELLSSIPAANSRDSYRNDQIELIFSERVKALGFVSSVTAIADSVDTLSFFPRWVFPNKVLMEFGTGIPREKSIEIKLDRGKILDAFDNPMGDSALSFFFRLLPADTVGSVSVHIGGSGNLKGELSATKAGSETYVARADSRGVFNFDKVIPGSYYFSYFDDSDSNGIWFPGVVNPFKPAEQFYYRADSVDVRSRWTTEIEWNK